MVAKFLILPLIPLIVIYILLKNITLEVLNYFVGQTNASTMEKPIASLLHCKNCETTFEGKFCPNCGQSVFEYQRPFRFLLADFTGNLFAFDTRFWKSLKALTIKPGRLTKDFIQGKRARYMSPFRFYIFVSFLFLFIFSGFLGHEVSVSDENKQDVYKVLDEAKNNVVTRDATAIDSVTTTENTFNFEFGNDTSLRSKEEKEEKLAKVKDGVVKVMENPKIYMNSFLKFLSWALFLIMPVYAGILWLFNRKTAPYYYSHLILAVNQHSFWFLILSLYFSIQYFLPNKTSDPEFFLLLLLPIHTFLGFKQLFERSWLRTLSKSIGIFLMYGFVLTISIGVIFGIWIQFEFL